MSLVDFRQAALTPMLGSLSQCEFDGLLEPLSHAERRDVRDMLALVVLRLAGRAEGVRHFRTRLDAVIASLIGVVDALDGDCDLEEGYDRQAASEDEGAQCDDEGQADDNGLADEDGALE